MRYGTQRATSLMATPNLAPLVDVLLVLLALVITTLPMAQAGVPAAHLVPTLAGVLARADRPAHRRARQLAAALARPLDGLWRISAQAVAVGIKIKSGEQYRPVLRRPHVT